MITLLDSGVRQGQIDSGGWVGAHGGDMPIVEPGTGGQLGQVGRDGDLIVAQAADLQRWVSRETGAIDGLARFAVGVAAQECYDAATLASRPLGRDPAGQPAAAEPAANLDAFTDQRWITIRGDIPAYPF
jgi:benzaldehyde dehydrogenase (NAD)